MIVKVQVSLATSHQNPQVLVYNEDRSVRYEGDADVELLLKMDGRPKMFCVAALVNGELELYPEAEVGEQGW